MKIKYSVFIWLISIILVSNSFAQTSNVLVYALEAMPYCGRIDGTPSGLAIDVLKEATNYGAPNFIFIFDIPWLRAQKTIQEADKKLVAIIPFSQSDSRKQEYKWISKLFSTKFHFYSYNKVCIQSIEEAKGLRIGVVRGHVIGSTLNSLGITNLDNHANNAYMNIIKLMNNRFDAIAGSDLISIYNWKKTGHSMDKLKKGISIGNTTDVFIAANNNFPEDVARSISKAIEKMKKDGVYQNILDKWSR